LGRNLANTLLDADWKVTGISRSPNTISHVNYSHHSIDITNQYDVVALVTQLDEIDLLVNNAAIFKMKRFDESSLDDIDNILDTNIKGSMYMTLRCLPLVRPQSKIIFINSVAGTVELENQSIYCASKFALTAFAGVLGKELRERQIKVVSLHPGGINTGLWNDQNPYPCGDVANALNPQDISNLILHILGTNNIEFKNIKLFPDIEWH
jgi:NADP-dependent 3-hydroxy acid dehydrogenase YdfG